MDLKERLKQYEGTIEYQSKLGYFKNGKFWAYKDNLGFPTIGYGHLVQKGESFPNGMTSNEAELQLLIDIKKAKGELSSLNLGVLPQDIEDYLVIMLFQLGLGGVKKFKKLLVAAKNHDRNGMRRESVDSLWYRQTPNRVKDMNGQLK
ncbi:lysozyme [Klebsiella variicola]|uniref:glycoside hydrolase family protein n=1 Tax=Klebsiella variicola TaxID=244366 RepID=UPI000D745F4D|nr:glycoside hydrolase family protein [Klebsiella variicola]PXL35871.1 lysozyme [Klebsiella variicola]